MPIDFLKDVEQKFDVQKVQFLNTPIWPYLRIKIAENYRSQKFGIASRSQKLSWKTIIKLIFTSFYGINLLFKLKKFDSFAFSSSERRKEFKGKYHDRVIEPVVNNQNCLLFENAFPLGKHYPKNEVPSKNVISESILQLGSILFYILYKSKYSLKNESILHEVFMKYEISYKYSIDLKRFLGQYYLFRFILKFCNLKAVFFVFPSSSMGYIKALKEKSIPVIEFQHGVINNKHFAYNVYTDLGNHLYPDSLLVYGKEELNLFGKNNYFINKKKVTPIGYYFLNLIAEEPVSHGLQHKYSSSFDYLIAVSFQEPFESMLMDFLNKAARLNPSIGYLIVRRDFRQPLYSKNMPKNILVPDDINIYDAIKISDYHATINSTCALEAVYMGRPNIFIDINNFASDYYLNRFNQIDKTYFLKNPEEMVYVILNKSVDIKSSSNPESYFFESNFNKNLNQFLKSLDLLKSNHKYDQSSKSI